MILDQFPQIRGVILDGDGVLWTDNRPIGNLPAIFARMQQIGLQITVATNNATKTTAEHRLKLAGFGVNLESWQVVSSSQAVGFYLQKKHPARGPIYVVGDPSLVEALQEYGFQHTEDSSSGVLAVVAGLDHHLTYDRLRQACTLIRKGAEFIGTNPDRTFPTPQGLIPGAGSILAALEAATDVRPVIAGKPSPALFELAMARMHLEPGSTLVVGDRLDTDIAGGQAVGCLTALMLSGVTPPEKVSSWKPAPTLVAANLEALIG